MKINIAKLGPGLMLAAAAVGVSHLVHATRAGAGFGLSLVWMVILISVLKYPAFRFAVDYASQTDRSLVHAYSRLGRIALAWLTIAMAVDFFVATTAVALVTAGLFISVFDLPYSGPQVAIALCLVTAAILINGHYAKAERIVKLLVLLFSVLALVATLLALPELGSNGRDLFGELKPGWPLAAFVIAMAGWMPMPLSGTIFLSMWAREKKATSSVAFGHKTAIADLRFGWVLAVVLAVCFVLLGTAILFQTDRVAPASAGEFATELLAIFTSAIGAWSYPLIAIAAIAVMWSGVFALMDVLPRVSARLADHVAGRAEGKTYRYSTFLVIQFLGITLILLFMMRNFGTFIDFATSAGFISAPALAYFNYRAVTSPDVAASYRPTIALLVWHWVGFAAMALFAVAFFVQRVS
jgi:Mn2+/Fe2+ NRAMP family transporter